MQSAEGEASEPVSGKDQKSSPSFEGATERKGESADLEGHKLFSQKTGLPIGDGPLEATAWENGFVPEATGLPTDQLERRIQGSLPPLAHMVSRPRQPIIYW